MSKSLITSVLLAVAILCGTGNALAQGKIATVDLKKLFENYWKTRQADANLKERAGEFDKKLKQMVEDGRKAQDDYKKLLETANDQAVSSEEREKRKKSAEGKLLEIREIEQSVAQFDRQARAQLGDQQRRMRDNVLREIQDTINTKAKSGGFSMVVDSTAESAVSTPVILFTDGSADITEDVLKQLNANAPADLPKKAEDDKPKK